jgi:hypothetical protein
VTVDEAQRRKTLARWHRRLALLVGLWLALLALSGIFINHAHDWGLDRDPLPRPLLSLVYGIEKDAPDLCAMAEPIGPACSEVFARVALPAGEMLLSATQLILLDGQGRVLEMLAAGHLGLSGIESGVRQGDDLYLSDGNTTVRTDPDLLEFEVLDAATAGALDGAPWQRRGVLTASVTWERLLLDLHAARFLGPAARWANDLMAGLILVLVVSGAWLYRAKRRRD